MKTCFSLGLAVLAGCGMADAKPAGRSSHQELEARRQRMMERDAEVRRQEPVESVAPAAARPKNLLERSDFLSFGDTATLVPKGALLCVPPHLEDRIALRPGSRIMTWPDFQTANRGWVSTVEVTLAQAEGKEPLPESLRRHLASSGNVVVATLAGGPISVLPVRDPQPSNADKP